MKNVKNLVRTVAVAAVAIALAIPAGEAFAGERGGRRDWGGHSSHQRPRSDWRGNSCARSPYYIAPLFAGLGYLYAQASLRQAPRTEYVVLQQPVPVVVAHPTQISVPTTDISVTVPNSNGSYTLVILEKHLNGYIGPQGEFYPGHPTVEQLRVLYGK